MSTSSRVAQDAGEAMSESSWTVLAKEKEREWWSIDLEGEMEKLEVEGSFSEAEGGSMDPERKMGIMGHWSARKMSTKEGSEEVKVAEYEEQGMEVDEVVPGMQPSRKVLLSRTEGGYVDPKRKMVSSNKNYKRRK